VSIKTWLAAAVASSLRATAAEFNYAADADADAKAAEGGVASRSGTRLPDFFERKPPTTCEK